MSEYSLEVRDEKALKSKDRSDVNFIQLFKETAVSLMEIVYFIFLDDVHVGVLE